SSSNSLFSSLNIWERSVPRTTSGCAIAGAGAVAAAIAGATTGAGAGDTAAAAAAGTLAGIGCTRGDAGVAGCDLGTGGAGPGKNSSPRDASKSATNSPKTSFEEAAAATATFSLWTGS